MTGRAGEWRARLLLAGISTFLALGLAEVAARRVLRPGATTASGTPIAEFSPTLGWRTRALGSQRIRRDDFDVTISLNSLGLRGPELAHEPAPGRRRLAIMGDSFAHGYYVSEPNTLRGRLGAALRSCAVDVVNGGGPGYSTDQEWLFFTEEIHLYQPGEVVLLFYYNDLFFNTVSMGTGNRPKPLFVERESLLELFPPPDAPRGRNGEESVGDEWPRAPLFHHSALWAFAASRLQRSRPDWSRSLARFDLAPTVSTEIPEEYLPFAPRDTREKVLVDGMWDRTRAILRGFRDDVRRRGGGFSVFYVPARFEVNDDAWRYLRLRYGTGWPWDRGAVSLRLTRLLASLDIPLMEATAALHEAEESASPAYLPIDGHWNARGNEIAFDALYPPMRRAFACGT